MKNINISSVGIECCQSIKCVSFLSNVNEFSSCFLLLFQWFFKWDAVWGIWTPTRCFWGKAPAAKRFPGYDRGLRERWMRESRCYFFLSYAQKVGVRVAPVIYAYGLWRNFFLLGYTLEFTSLVACTHRPRHRKKCWYVRVMLYDVQTDWMSEIR